jgi:hypothetical protein
MTRHNYNIKNNIIVPGILIEGDDYTGKTLISKEIVRILSKKKLELFYGHYYLSDSSIIKTLNNHARACKSDIEKNNLRIAAALIDLYIFYIKKNTFYVQDRNWVSINKKYNLEGKNKLLLKHHVFSTNIYLKASLETQKKRYIKVHGKNKDFISFFLKENSQNNILLPAEENWYVLQTDFKSIEELTDEILVLAMLN